MDRDDPDMFVRSLPRVEVASKIMGRQRMSPISPPIIPFEANKETGERGRTGGAAGSTFQEDLPAFDVDLAYICLLMSAIIYERSSPPKRLFRTVLTEVVTRISFRMPRICTMPQ
jgi:hypothetical protein